MILIITHKQDYTADFIVDKLNRRKIEYYRFNCEDVDQKGYQFHFGKKISYKINNLNLIDSVWFRRTKLPDLTGYDIGEHQYLSNEYDSLLSNMYQIINAKKWLSFPPNVYTAENKLLQLKQAQNVGLVIPDTIVTNNADYIIEFAQNHNDSIIVKPLSGGRVFGKDGVRHIYTNKVDKQKINNLKRYLITPSIFQEYIDKSYELRITIVGDQIFSAKVNSQNHLNTMVDWRREKLLFEPYNLPGDVANKCLALMKSLNISFGAIDIIKTPNNKYVFLEINPNGQWAWIESDTKHGISDEIIKYLTT